MEFFTMRDLRSRSGEIWERLREQREAILTSNGRPVALLISVSSETVEDDLLAFRRARAQLAVSRMRQQSAESGQDQTTVEEIEAEIQSARRERVRS